MLKNFVILNNGVYGIYSEHTKIFTENNEVISKDKETYKDIDMKEVPSKTRKLLNAILILKNKRISKHNKQKSIENQIFQMEEKIKELKKEIDNIERERIGFQKEINNLVKNYSDDKKVTELKKSVKGNELEKMSFFNGTLNTIKAKAIISKSKRPITYTYGLSYRNPTTYHIPITKEKAFEIISTQDYLDISFGTNEIHLNAYSENDMW